MSKLTNIIVLLALLTVGGTYIYIVACALGLF